MKNKQKEMELEKFKSRWRRFFGQKTREGNPGWTDLLNCEWLGWASRTLEKHDLGHVKPSRTGGDPRLRYYYQLAVDEADMKDLGALDNLYCKDYLIKGK